MSSKQLAIGATAIALILLAVGCTRAPSLDTLRDTPRVGLRHNVALMNEYEGLGTQRAEQSDWVDAEYFGQKGLAAAAGQDVLPDEVGSREVASGSVAELESARATLVAVLFSGGREFQPERTAQCQVLYDCWLEQVEEMGDTGQAMACQREHYDCMAAVRLRAADAPEVERFIVYFSINSTALDTIARTVVADAVETATANGQLAISITGHTDTVGSPAQNLILSMHRAERVRDALVAGGIDPSRISINAVGEDDLATQTGDNVPERNNRRVVVVVS